MALGKAYIEIHADTKPFERELRRDLEAAIAKAGPSVRKMGKKTGKDLGDAMERGSADAGRRAGNAFSRTFDRVVGRKSKGTAEKQGNIFTRAFRKTFTVISEIFGSLLNVSGKGPIAQFAAILSPVLIIALLEMLAGLLGMLQIIGTTLTSLAGMFALVLPSSIGLAIGAMLAFKLATHDVNNAISALFSKDPKKLNEALKKLTPSAQQFVLALRPAVGMLDEIKKKAQEAFFKPLVGPTRELVKNLGPKVAAGLIKAAAALGALFAPIEKFLASPGFTFFVKALFDTLARNLQILAPGVLRLVQALTGLAMTFLGPTTELTERFTGFLEKFADWIDKNISNGNFVEFFNKALKILHEIGLLAGSIFRFWGSLFGDANGDTISFLQHLREIIDRATAFFNSPRGKQFLHDLAVNAEFLLGQLALTLHIIGLILEGLFKFERFVKRIGEGFRSFAFWLDSILRKLHLIANEKGKAESSIRQRGEGLLGGFQGRPKGFAEGGIFNQPTLGVFGEAGPEVIMPLSNPQRAAELAQQSGLSDMLGTDQGGDIYVYVGNEPVDARIVRFNRQQGRALAFGPRGM